MKYLREAIYGGLVKALGTTSVYHRLVPRGTAMPYYTYKVDASFRDASTVNRGVTRWDVNIRVECFGIDPDVLETAQDAIEQFFVAWEPGAGTAAGSVAKIDPVDEDLDVEPDRDDEGNEVWHGTQIFEALYSKGPDVSSSSSSSSSTSESSSSTASSASSSSDSTSSSSTESSSSVSASSESSGSSSTSSTSSYSSASESSSSDSGP